MLAVDRDRAQLESASRQFFNVDHSFVRSNGEAEMLDQCAEVSEELLARDLLLIRGLNRQPRQRKAVGAGVKEHLRRIPLDRRPDLAGVDLHVIDARLLQCHGQLEPDRPGADDRYMVRFDHAFIPSSRKTLTFASIMTWCSRPRRSASFRTR